MLRLRALFPPLALLLLLAGAGSAAPVRADRDTLDRGTPAPRVQSAVLVEELRTLPRVRLFLAEVTILPSGRTVTRTVATRPTWPGPEPDPGMQLLVLPSRQPCRCSSWRPRDSSLPGDGGRARRLPGADGRPSLGADPARPEDSRP
jgi:hypothetical protein